MFDPNGYGLEIGPSYNPIVPKRLGFRVDVLDHATQDGLQKKYRNEPGIDVDNIEPVDFVSDGRRMRDVIGQVGLYDFIVSSHSIEHMPDVIGFLQECEALLKPDGVIVLAVPDKRRCFDRYRPVSTLGQVVQAHLEGRTKHTYQSLFDHSANFCTIDGRSGWSKSDTAKPTLRNTVHQAAKFAESALGDAYVDSHGWQFTPSSFRLMMQDLADIGRISFREQSFHGTDIFEFFVVLSRRGGARFDRAEMLEAIALECTENVLPLPAAEDRTGDDEEVAKLRCELAQVRAQLARIEASSSWRFTAPARSVRQRLRTVRLSFARASGGRS